MQALGSQFKAAEQTNHERPAEGQQAMGSKNCQKFQAEDPQQQTRGAKKRMKIV